jgi:hypothetical protein
MLLILKARLSSSVQSIIGATDSLRSIRVLCFSEEMPIFAVFSMLRVSAVFPRTGANL